MTTGSITLGAEDERAGYRLLAVDGCEVPVPIVALAALGLGPNDPVPEHLRARVEALARTETTFQTALRALAGRARTLAELRRWLLERHHPRVAVDVALGRLAARGWLDDRRFAEEYAARRAGGDRGPDRVVLDLMRKGVERSVAEAGVRAALADENAGADDAGERLARRRAAQMTGLPASVRKRRLLAYLARRGFRGPAVSAVVDEVCRDEPRSGEPPAHPGLAGDAYAKPDEPGDDLHGPSEKDEP